MKLHIKNQLNGDLTIEFCCGQEEYTLEPEEEVTLEVQDEDCMYLDIVR
jgi:hypothetical protein